MPIFSIKYHYSRDSVVHHETAIVRASSPDVAKEKLARLLTRSYQFRLDNFKFDKISLSLYNLILV